MGKEGTYIKSIVYGGLDGTVTTFAIVSGVVGASLNPGIVLILGFANLIADGISMAAGDFLSSRAQNDYNRSEKGTHNGHKKELQQFYHNQGMTEKDATALAQLLTNNNTVITDINQTKTSPGISALVTFLSFATFGLIPLLSYLFALIVNIQQEFLVACILTGLTLCILGLIRGTITKTHPLKAAAETLCIGGIAAIAAYSIGYGLSHLI